MIRKYPNVRTVGQEYPNSCIFISREQDVILCLGKKLQLVAARSAYHLATLAAEATHAAHSPGIFRASFLEYSAHVSKKTRPNTLFGIVIFFSCITKTEFIFFKYVLLSINKLYHALCDSFIEILEKNCYCIFSRIQADSALYRVGVHADTCARRHSRQPPGDSHDFFNLLTINLTIILSY